MLSFPNSTNSESWFQIFLPFTIYDIWTSSIGPSSFLNSNSYLFNLPLSGRRWIIISKRHPGTPQADPQSIWFGDQRSGSKHSLSVVRQVVVLCITLQPSVCGSSFGLITMSLKSKKYGVTLQLTLSEETYSRKLCIRVIQQKYCNGKAQHSMAKSFRSSTSGAELSFWDVQVSSQASTYLVLSHLSVTTLLKKNV